MGKLTQKPKEIPTLAKFINTYDQQQLADRKPKTRTRTLLTLRQFQDFIGRKGKVRIDGITVQRIEEFKAMRLETCKPATVNRDLEVIRGLFSAAVNYDLLPDNPVSKVKKVKQTERQVVFLESGEQAALIQAAQTLPARSLAHTPYLPVMIVLCLNTGIRRGELFHLRWRHVDIDAKRLYVCNDDGFQTKSGKDRVIGLNKKAIEALLQWKQWFVDEKERAERLLTLNGRQRNERGHRRLDMLERLRPMPERLVFPSLKVFNKDGSPKVLENVDSGFERAVELAGIKRKIGLHVLRHTFAVNLCRAGVPLYQISKLMGHASVQTTEMHYLRFAKDEAIDVVDVLV